MQRHGDRRSSPEYDEPAREHNQPTRRYGRSSGRFYEPVPGNDQSTVLYEQPARRNAEPMRPSAEPVWPRPGADDGVSTYNQGRAPGKGAGGRRAKTFARESAAAKLTHLGGRQRVVPGHASIIALLVAGVLAIPALLLAHAGPSSTGNRVPTSGSPYPANIDFEAGAANSPGKYNPAALAAPGIGGVAVQLNWDAMEPTPGTFNWAPVDQEVADWAAHNKKFILIVRLQGGSSCTGTQTLPAWEIAKVPHLCAAFPGDVIPDYLDPTYTADSHAYIQAIGQHFAQSPFRGNLAYVRIAMGRGGENMPVKGGPSDPAWAQLQQWGLTPSALVQYQEQRLLFEQSLFPYTHVVYNVDPLGVKDPQTGQSIQQAVALFAAAHGMGVGYNGLTPGSTGGIAANGVAQRYPNTYITFQTVYSIGNTSTAQADISTASNAGGRAIEWYTGDATNPANQPAFEQWQATVTSKFGTMNPGSGPVPPVATTPTSTGGGGTSTPGPSGATSTPITGVPCTVTVQGIQKLGTCTGTFVPSTSGPVSKSSSGDSDDS
jgi:hypothetical protein